VPVKDIVGSSQRADYRGIYGFEWKRCGSANSGPGVAFPHFAKRDQRRTFMSSASLRPDGGRSAKPQRVSSGRSVVFTQ